MDLKNRLIERLIGKKWWAFCAATVLLVYGHISEHVWLIFAGIFVGLDVTDKLGIKILEKKGGDT